MGGSEPSPVPGRSLRQVAYLTAGLGIVHAVLLLVSFWILRSMPGPGASEATLIAFYGGADRRRVLAVGLYLLPFAAIAFVWFIVALRMWVGSHGRPEQALFSKSSWSRASCSSRCSWKPRRRIRSTLRWWSSPMG